MRIRQLETISCKEKFVERKLREEKEMCEKRGKIYTGKRGGRYTEDVTKDGRPYRRYF